jgi:acetoin utilization deacetylase AcuC-like enzyme
MASPRIVFNHQMVAPAQGGSPSAAKPAAVVAAWRQAWPYSEVRDPQPVSRADLSRAHDHCYVDDVLALKVPNGFGTVSAEVAASLLYTSGALLTASRWALSEGGAVAAPASGFHHACWDHGGGFCTFNGLMVAALALQAERPGLRVGILDYDYHYGNGTDDIVRRVGCAGIVHVTAGERWQFESQAPDFITNIACDLQAMDDCDIVLYQAGADPHIDDPLGGFLSTWQLWDRDRRVFEGLHERGIPVAWTLAGGYQQPLDAVIDIHLNTMRAVVAVG